MPYFRGGLKKMRKPFFVVMNLAVGFQFQFKLMSSPCGARGHANRGKKPIAFMPTAPLGYNAG